MLDTPKPFASLLVPGITLVAALLMSAAVAAADPDPERPYTAECDDDGSNCRVDRDTYVGWRTYNGNCARCHGAGGVGSSLAPDLMQRISRKDMSYEHFKQAVRDGVSGEMGVMPPWGENKNVMKRLDNVWAYLLARTDGVLAVGRPDRLEQEDEQDEDKPANWE